MHRRARRSCVFQAHALDRPVRERQRRPRAHDQAHAHALPQPHPHPGAAVHLVRRQAPLPQAGPPGRGRLHDPHRAGPVPVGAVPGVQHVLDPLHLVHPAAAGDAPIQPHRRPAGAQDHHGGVQRVPVAVRHAVELRLGQHPARVHP
ncbi:hypothetical protein FOCC_FOCC017645, partial [Frankliniella occidentalis]